MSENSSELCKWCHFAEAPVVKKSGLCKRCHRLERESEKAQRDFDALKDESQRFNVKWDLDVAKSKVNLAQLEGELFATPDPDDDLGMILEDHLRELAQLVLGPNQHLFRGHASILRRLADKESLVRFIDVLNQILQRQWRRSLHDRAVAGVTTEFHTNVEGILQTE